MGKIKKLQKVRNEIKVLEAFIQEFNPLYAKEEIKGMQYDELIQTVKEITEEM